MLDLRGVRVMIRHKVFWFLPIMVLLEGHTWVPCDSVDKKLPCPFLPMCTPVSFPRAACAKLMASYVHLV